jgi:hypothetical protein
MDVSRDIDIIWHKAQNEDKKNAGNKTDEQHMNIV